MAVAFSPLVARWFGERFGTPTPAQAEGWPAIARGADTLIAAPTGSGKTLAAFTFYRGGSIVPVVGIAADWVNQWNMEPFWTVSYVVRDDFVVNVAQRYFVTPKGRSTPIFESWGLGGLNNSRSETELVLTYQF